MKVQWAFLSEMWDFLYALLACSFGLTGFYYFYNILSIWIIDTTV
jgi:hypothetical protein